MVRQAEWSTPAFPMTADAAFLQERCDVTGIGHFLAMRRNEDGNDRQANEWFHVEVVGNFLGEER